MKESEFSQSALSFTESELNFHFKVTKALRNAKSLFELTRIFIEHLKYRFPDKKPTVLLYDTLKQDLFLPSDADVKSDIRIEVDHINYNGSVAVRCFLDKKNIIIRDTRQTDLINIFWVEKLKLKSLIVLPIIHDDKAIGVLRVDDSLNYDAFSEKLIKFYEYLLQIFSIEAIRVINQNYVIKKAIVNTSFQRIKNIINGLPLPSFTIDKDEQITFVNKELLKLLGVSENNQKINISLDTLFNPEALTEFRKAFKSIKNNGLNSSFECKIDIKQTKRLMKVVLSNLAIEETDRPQYMVCFEDKHEQKTYEKEVGKLITRYKQLFEDAPIGYYELDAEGRIINVNRFISNLLGYSHLELVGRSVFNIFPVRYRASYKESFLKRLKKELHYSGNERIYLTKEHKEIPCFIEDKYVFDDDSNVIGIITTVMDMSDLKKTKQELESSQERIVSLYSLSQMIYFNEQEIFEYTIEELLHLTSSGFGFIIFIDDLNSKITLHLFIKNSEAEKLRTEVYYLDIDKTGSWFPSLLNGEAMMQNEVGFDFNIDFPNKDIDVRNILAVPIYELSKVAIIAGIGNKNINYIEWDLVQTDLFINEMWKSILKKKSESALIAEKENLKITLNSISEGVITTDFNDRIISVNRSVEEIFEFNEQELLGTLIKDFLSLLEIRDENNKYEMEIAEVYNILHNPLKDIDLSRNYFAKSKSGTQKIIQIHCVDIMSATDEKGGWNYFIKDITDIINIEQKSSLSQKLESLGQLAAGIAHEINTPMQYINDNNRFLQDSFRDINNYLKEIKLIIDSNNAAAQELKDKYDLDFLIGEIPLAIEQTREGIEKVNKIIVAMKNFSHHQGTEKLIADLNYGIESTATITKNAWKYVADLSLDLDPNLPSILCFSDELNQVFLNMIINSAHAIEEKYGKSAIKGTIKIQTQFDENNVIIKIEDNGNGIPPKNVSKIFDPFFTTKQVGKGTGQGLTIAHDIIVNKHNGKIMVDSVYQEGTVFTILIPYNKTQLNK